MSRRAERPLLVHLAYLIEGCCIENWLRAAGVQHFFVEQDEVAEDPVESLRQSYRAVEALKF